MLRKWDSPSWAQLVERAERVTPKTFHIASEGLTTPREESGVRVSIGHIDYPDWEFVVWLSDSGVAVGFEVRPLGSVPYGVRGGRRKLTADPTPITARMMHSLPVGELQRAAVLIERRHLSHLATMSPRFVEWAEAMKAAPRPGRRGRDDRFYAALARDYVVVLSTSSSPVADLGEKYAMSRSQVRNLLHEARQRGLLTTPATRGQAGGELTDRARALLEEGDDDGEH